MWWLPPALDVGDGEPAVGIELRSEARAVPVAETQVLVTVRGAVAEIDLWRRFEAAGCDAVLHLDLPEGAALLEVDAGDRVGAWVPSAAPVDGAQALPLPCDTTEVRLRWTQRVTGRHRVLVLPTATWVPSGGLSVRVEGDVEAAYDGDAPDEDVVLAWEPTPGAVAWASEDHVALVVEAGRIAEPRPRQVVFAVDPDAEDAAIPVVRRAIAELRPDDLFDVRRTDRVGSLHVWPSLPDPTSAAAAEDWLRAQGERDGQEGLSAAFEPTRFPEHLPIVVWIAARPPWFELPSGDARLFVLATQGAWSAVVAEAQASGGLVTSDPDELLAAIRTPGAPVSVDWGDWRVADVVAPRALEAWEGAPLVLHARVVARGAEPPQVDGRPVAVREAGADVGRRWAEARIVARPGKGAEKLSLAWGLPSPRTALVAGDVTLWAPPPEPAADDCGGCLFGLLGYYGLTTGIGHVVMPTPGLGLLRGLR